MLHLAAQNGQVDLCKSILNMIGEKEPKQLEIAGHYGIEKVNRIIIQSILDKVLLQIKNKDELQDDIPMDDDNDIVEVTVPPKPIPDIITLD